LTMTIATAVMLIRRARSAEVPANLKTIRTDVVGSLLRPPWLREERIRFEEGKLSAERMREREDKAVRGAVQLQESVGLDVITDGEARRLNFQDGFGIAVEGFDAQRTTVKSNELNREGSWDVRGMHDMGTAVSHRRPAKARLQLVRNVPLEEYAFVSKVAKTPAKVSLIGPRCRRHAPGSQGNRDWTPFGAGARQTCARDRHPEALQFGPGSKCRARAGALPPR
jgi:Cobalamin-independent synthase, Catalytic domain